MVIRFPRSLIFLDDTSGCLIICIVTAWHGDYTSHVGLAVRDAKGTLRFLHASKNSRAVIVDRRLSDYLNRYFLHAGIMVGCPNDLP